MAQYRETRSRLVDAAQWDGSVESCQAVLRLANGAARYRAIRTEPGGPLNETLIIGGYDHMKIHDWLVKIGDETYEVVSPDEFAARYEAAV